MKRAIIGLLVGATLLSGCSLASSAINETCLIYSGGITQDKEFEKVLVAGATNNGIGVGSDSYCYRNDQRSWLSGQDAPEVTVVSKDEINLNVPYQLYFKLNTTEEVLVEFHENIGVKTEAWRTDGWINMLNTYFGPQVDRAMDEAALNFTWRDLRSDEATRREFQEDVVLSLKTKINEVIGGDYFCGPDFVEGGNCGDFTFTVGKPEPTNQDLIAQIEQEQINDASVKSQESENRRIIAELEARRIEIELYGREGYVCIRQAEIAAAAGVAPPVCLFTGGSGSQVLIGK